MAVFSRSVTVDWTGSIMEGKGQVKAGSGAFSLPVTFPARIGEPAGHTSPEELVAASHAACYAMTEFRAVDNDQNIRLCRDDRIGSFPYAPQDF